jgi:putative oxidoreductase
METVMKTSNRYQEWTLLVVRIIISAIFLVAGYYKLSFWNHAPEGMQPALLYLTRFLSIAEPLGAIAVLVGIWTRLAAIGLSVIMIGAICFIQFVFGMGFVTPTSPGWNFPLTVLGACLILITFGAGRWSVDAHKFSTQS